MATSNTEVNESFHSEEWPYQLAEMLLQISEEENYPVQIDARDKWDNTPLHLAVQNSNNNAAEFLLRRGADPNLVNAEGLTPLHLICKLDIDVPDLMKLLFKIGKEKHQPVQVDAKDEKRRTPLRYAVASLLPDVIDVLLDHGADLSNFVFPTESDFCSRSEPWSNASGIMVVSERLANKGYELDRGDAKPANYDECWNIDWEFWAPPKKTFEELAANMLMRGNDPGLTLNDLIQLRPEEAEKLLTNSHELLEILESNDY
ncbi:ankyrin repeat, PH and SEC7 domain containing protein secG-like [Trichogramma pretiosum]|uniref:ankyrin repeat, PH and SEC7 domain containing protein secG-like n=1 Tax=Trichogramma pretiosum TaxID=7493 RepID=UPI0006C93CD3|nr:ankyrin repeat, PH and SEC7 domain containing protein secG-like [Trichogramma pretiosum]